MRFVILFLTVSWLSALPAVSADETSFDAFLKSREVVATLYFQANSEDLAAGERDRISDTISQLRKLQKNGRMIRVEGFSSRNGDKEANFRLSFFRARTVADIIEAKGLPAEITLTGYGDLLAESDNHSKERRVEIASYVKLASIKRIKVADRGSIKSPGSHSGVTRAASSQELEIDSFTVDRAIRQKIADKQQELAEKQRKLFPESSTDLSQTKEKFGDDLDRGYSQWRKSVDPSYAPKLSQSRQAANRELERGYSQWQKNVNPEMSPGVTQVTPFEAPAIDALMIEQAIMEKTDAKPLVPSGAVTQVDFDY